MQGNRLRSLALVVVLAATSLAAFAPAAAAKSGDHRPNPRAEQCTWLNALSLLLFFEQRFDKAQGPPPCQYRLFWDQRTLTFCEDDVILGGVVSFWTFEEIEAFGWSRAEAIADLKLLGHRVWLDGVEQRLIATPYRNENTATFGRIVSSQHAFITRLPPGDHVSVYVESYPGEPDFVSTVYLHVLPRGACN